MTPTAIALFVLSAMLVWGGLVASTIYLIRRPETSAYPAGGYDESPEHSVVVRDT